MSRSVKVTEVNWTEAPKYAFTRTEVKNGPASDLNRKTLQVMMIDGTPFLKLIGVQGHPLAAAQSQEEEQKLQREMSRRQNEAPHDRQRRIDKYNEERNRDHAFLTELRNAFDYQISGRQNVDGREVIILRGVPKPKYIPTSRETKILVAMQVTFWVDQHSYQWRRVEAEVKSPVSIYGAIGKVNPGTKFILDQGPVSGSVWLPAHFQIQVRATALGFIKQDSSREEIYSDYSRIGGSTLLSKPTIDAKLQHSGS